MKDGDVIGYGNIEDGIRINDSQPAAISSSELRIGLSHKIDFDLVIGTVYEDATTGVVRVTSNFAETSASSPFSLLVDGPDTLDAVLSPLAPHDVTGDTSETWDDTPLDITDHIIGSPGNDPWPGIVLAGEDGTASTSDDGELVLDDGVSTASDNVNIVYVRDNDTTAFNYLGGGSTDFFFNSASVVSGDVADGGAGVDLMYNGFVYNPNYTGEEGIVVDLNFGTIDVRSIETDVHPDLEITNIELIGGTHLSDTFYGTLDYTSYNNIQTFAPGAGSDTIWGASESDVNTSLDYTFDDGSAVPNDGTAPQGVVIITGLDPQIDHTISYSVSDGNDIQEVTDYWNGWRAFDQSIVTDEGYILNQDIDEYSGDTIILDHTGYVDIARNIDYFIGTSHSDIMLGTSGENDTFNANFGERDFFDGGLGGNDYDILMVEGHGPIQYTDMFDGSAVDYDSVVVQKDRETESFNVSYDNAATDYVTSSYTPATVEMYVIHATDAVLDIIAGNVTDSYDVANEYEFFVHGDLAGWQTSYGSTYTSIGFDHTAKEISITSEGDFLGLLNSASLEVVMQETTEGDFVVTYDSFAFDHDENSNTADITQGSSTFVRDVEEIVITEQAAEYLPTLADGEDVQGLFIDSYEYVGDGAGDLGDMFYVTTDVSLDGTNGYSSSDFSVAGEIFYSGHHTDFDRNDNTTSNWATTIAAALGSTGRASNLWNEEVAEFFVMHEDSAQQQFEVTVVYDSAKQTWRVDNEHFDTFQNVDVDAQLAQSLSAATGQTVGAGEYRVFYSAAFKDINTVIEGNDGVAVDSWDFDFPNFPSIPRSTFYIEVGGQTTGDAGDTGAITTADLAAIKAVTVEWNGTEFEVARDNNGDFPIPLVNLSTFRPTGLDLAANTSDSVSARDISEIVVGGKGADTLMGRGGADTYQIAKGDGDGASSFINKTTGEAIDGDVINEIGGKLSDAGDSVNFVGDSTTTQSGIDISMFTFSRTKIRNEDVGNTLKIEADYDDDGVVDDTVYLFNQYDEDQPFRQVEQLLLDDGWDPDEAWNLIVGEKFDYEVESGTGSLDWFIGTGGHDVFVTRDSGESWVDLNGESDVVVLGDANDTISFTYGYDYDVPSNSYDSGTTVLDDVSWSDASNSGNIHQILGFVSGEDRIDLRWLGITEPDDSGMDFASHSDGGNTYLYTKDNATGGENIKVLAEFVGVASLTVGNDTTTGDIYYDQDDIFDNGMGYVLP